MDRIPTDQELADAGYKSARDYLEDKAAYRLIRPLARTSQCSGPLADRMLRFLSIQGHMAAEPTPLISPFVYGSVKKADDGSKLISFGTSSYGYDIRCTRKFKIFTNLSGKPIDPKDLDGDMARSFHDVTEDEIARNGGRILLPPNSYALTSSVEKFCLPRWVTGICYGKSTYARCGIIVNVTPLEAGWSGHLTIEISNGTGSPAYVYPEEGLCQVLFMAGASECETSYADRGGKYQDQRDEITLARMG